MGRATAELMAAMGAGVALLDRTPEALDGAIKKRGLQTKLQTMTVQQTIDL